MSTDDPSVRADPRGEPPELPTLAQLVGANVRTIREVHGWTQDEFASRLADCGLLIARGSITTLERGDRNPDLGELILTAITLGCHLDSLLSGATNVVITEHATLGAELVRNVVTREPIRTSGAVGNATTPTFSEVRSMPNDPYANVGIYHITTPEVLDWIWHNYSSPGPNFAGEYSTKLREQWDAEEAVFQHHWNRGSEFERRIAKKLGISIPDLHALDIELWDQHVAQERDKRVRQASPDASPRTIQALRGHVTREMVDELQLYVDVRDSIMQAAEAADIIENVTAQIAPEGDDDGWWAPIQRTRPESELSDPRRQRAWEHLKARFGLLGIAIEPKETP